MKLPPDAPENFKSPHWSDGIKNALPSPAYLAAHPWLKPVAHRLLDTALWRMQHEAVARGVAIGIFWAFAVPFAQILFAAAHCVWWRGNIPVAAGVTLITNPFTIGFWLWLAYQLGSVLLDAPPPTPIGDSAGIMEWLAAFGGPAVLGMALFAVGGAALGYLIVRLAWRAKVWIKRRRFR